MAESTRDTPGAPSAVPGEGRGARWGRTALGRARDTGAPLCFQGSGPGHTGSSPQPGRPSQPRARCGKGAPPPPPPPVGGFTGFRGNECGAELGASVTEVPGKAGTGRSWCRVLRCCRRPAPGEWPRGAAPAPPAQGSRAEPSRAGAPFVCGLGALARSARGAAGARFPVSPRRAGPPGPGPGLRSCPLTPGPGPPRCGSRLPGEQGTPGWAGRLRVPFPAEAAPVRCGERSGARGAERSAGSRAGGVSGALCAVQCGAVHCVCAGMRWVRCRPAAGLPVVPEFLTP